MLDDETPPDPGETTAADLDVAEPVPAVTVHQPVAGDTTWLKLKDTVGVSANGNLEPLVDIGVIVTVPQMVIVEGKQEVADAVRTISIGHAEELTIFKPARFIEGGRIVETSDQRVVAALLQTGNFDVIDQPTKTALNAHVKDLRDATAEAANRSDEER